MPAHEDVRGLARRERIGGRVTATARDDRTLAVQIRDEIGALIERERLRPGDRLPTEAELSHRFRISRPALREGLKLLEQDGIIYVEHGRGRFVSAMAAALVERPITVFESITDMVRGYGYRLRNEVLALGEEDPSAEVRQALRLPPGARVIRLARLRLHGDEVLIYCEDFVPRSLVVGRLDAVDWTQSLLDILERHGCRPHMSSATVSSVALPEAVSAGYALDDFGPALLITEVAFARSGTPVLFARDYHRGSAFAFRFTRK